MADAEKNPNRPTAYEGKRYVATAAATKQPTEPKKPLCTVIAPTAQTTANSTASIESAPCAVTPWSTENARCTSDPTRPMPIRPESWRLMRFA
ncbi:MAG: hypothetical protein JNK82_31165 [Myxococcaceae bacterium]|nr:hypothetical protein [Myxococcaceae bacterium]